MRFYSTAKPNTLDTSIVRFFALCLMLATFAIGASAQIRIGDIKIPIPRNPQPRNPPTTNPNSTRTPNPNGNRTPTVPNVNQPTSTNSNNGESGATREETLAFIRDMGPYREGMYGLRTMALSLKGDNPQCHEVKSVRRDLEEGAAFLEVIKQKYPGIENPSWSNENTGLHKVGDWRRYAENREAIAKECVNARLGATLNSEIAGIESAIKEFEKREGYVLRRDFNDKEARHTELMEKYKEHYALVGLTKPDESVFVEYDKAMERLIALANQHAGAWVFPPTERDPMIEAKARGWLKDADPRATVVKIGMLHGEWQVNKQSNGIPSGRYKRGYVMFRKPGVQNCLVNNFSYEQNYIGGGRFNAMAITSGMSHVLRMQTCK